MVGSGTHNSDVDPILLIPAGEAINNVDSISGVKVINGSFSVDFPNL